MGKRLSRKQLLIKSGLRPLVMGILNVTPDSFSDGGKYMNSERAAQHAERMIQEGADIIDIGGEATGPNSIDVSPEEELRRVIPVIKAIRRKNPKAFISIDTYKAEVARQAIKAGASMVNDITALRGDPKMAGVVAATGVPIVLMYAKDKTARTTRTQKRYKDLMQTIKGFLLERLAYAQKAGIKKSQIIIDPGMGAFISAIPKYSFEILRRLGELKTIGCRILVGTSKKSFLLGSKEDRLIPTLLTHCVAIQNGASIIRVHDVKEHQILMQLAMRQVTIHSMKVTRTFSFSAAHHLTDYYGECERPHGHTYRLAVTVEGPVQPNGLVIDFVKIKELVQKKVLGKIDHQDLNDFFKNPSAENIAIWIWKQLKNIGKDSVEANAAPTVQLVEITLWEGDNTSVTYAGN